MKDIFGWLQEWYRSNCNGEWEHEYGIKIYTVDNPGWAVIIDLKHTRFEDLNIEYELVEKSESDWYGFSVKEGVFNGGGDPTKLKLIITKFKEVLKNN